MATATAPATAAAPATGRAASRSATFHAGRKAAAKALREEIGPIVGLLSIGDGAMDGVSPDILTHASIMDSSVKYKTLKKLKLQVLCGNLLDHIEDLEEELKKAKVEKAKVELESEEDVFFVGNGTGATTSRGELELKETVPTKEAREEDVMGVEEGNDVNVKVNATSNKSKLAKLAKLVKLAKSTNPLVPFTIRPTVTGGQGQGQGQAEAEEGLPGEPPGGGLHGRQLREQATPGLPRGRQGEDPQVHVHVVAHEDP
jgi:hypothetical protein